MRKQHIFCRILLPVMILLILFPPLSCLIFRKMAEEYAYEEANKDLAALQQNILPILENSFCTEQNISNQEKVTSFLRKVSLIARRMGGNAHMLIFASELRLIYPHEEEEKEMVKVIADECLKYIQENSADGLNNGVVEMEIMDGERYLVNIYTVPIDSPQIQYLITYCPTSNIGVWVNSASKLVLVIASVFALLATLVLWMVACSITKPLKQICHNSEKIGGGGFVEIESPFTLLEMEQLRLSMNKMSQKLKRAYDTQRSFFQNVSHELRNPLMSISGYAQGIEQGVFPDSQQAAHTILEESLRLTELVNSLLTLSRMENAQEPSDFSSVQISEIIDDSLDRFNGLAMKKNVVFQIRPFDHNICIYGDEDLCSKILDNLISNAIRYAKKTVTVCVESTVKTVSISVADDGDGISEKDIPHIFERCYKGKNGNFGLGLAIAQTAAYSMGGKLCASNQLECGAIFTLTLSKIE